ncbi:hypothetical protein HIM_08046 [Hirsutella minnesotensis 3608]|uniref:SCP domain-containing protein n=1 Tax=Hirsutella minnesotensis 3608 TaxID=1043627 RepID=A0A0F7ZYI3_9HYPO|nr:hypothetical protein HIM_08046 [Hirsutella minnesotensis 3608]
MKSSLFLAATGALLVAAGPIGEIEKREPVTQVVTEWVYATDVTTAIVTLAPGQEPPSDIKQEAAPLPTKVYEEPAGDDEPEVMPAPAPSLPLEIPVQYTPIIRPEPTAEPPPPPKSKPAPKPAPKPDQGSYPSPDNGNLDSYAKAMLDKHNTARQDHKVPLLRWNADLASSAQQSAQNCIDNHDNHGKGFGQNLAWLWSSGSEDNTKVALGGVDGWYKEKNNYNNLYGVPDPTSGNFNDIGHFTQMVWKATTDVGCATNRCQGGSIDWVTVCNYKQPGNVPGQFAKNVLTPLLS